MEYALIIFCEPLYTCDVQGIWFSIVEWCYSTLWQCWWGDV